LQLLLKKLCLPIFLMIWKCSQLIVVKTLLNTFTCIISNELHTHIFMWKNHLHLNTIIFLKEKKNAINKRKKSLKKHMKNLTFWPNPICWNINNQTLKQNEFKGFIKKYMPQWSTKRRNVNLKVYYFQKEK